MFRGSVVNSRLKYVFSSLEFDHLLNVFLIERELLRKFVRLTEDVNWLLEVLGDERDSVCAHLVHNTPIC